MPELRAHPAIRPPPEDRADRTAGTATAAGLPVQAIRRAVRGAVRERQQEDRPARARAPAVMLAVREARVPTAGWRRVPEDPATPVEPPTRARPRKPRRPSLLMYRSGRAWFPPFPRPPVRRSASRRPEASPPAPLTTAKWRCTTAAAPAISPRIAAGRVPPGRAPPTLSSSWETGPPFKT